MSKAVEYGRIACLSLVLLSLLGQSAEARRGCGRYGGGAITANKYIPFGPTPGLHPYYAGFDAIQGLRNSYNEKIARANNDLAVDRAELANKVREYEDFRARAAAYEAAVANQIADYRKECVLVEEKIAHTHNPRETARLHGFLEQEAELEHQASRNIAIEDAWVNHERQLLNNAQYNVSEDQEQIRDYSVLTSQLRH